MNQIKVISFDAEGTLVTPDFSQALWHETIPALYAEKHGLDLVQARKAVIDKYDKVGDQRLEWYDAGYWFNLLDLGSPEIVIQNCLGRACCYPEVDEVLSSLRGKYKLIVASGTPIEFLNYLLRDVESNFSRIFSSISHYKQIKSPEFYLAICREMGVAPYQVVHVGDNFQFDFLASSQVGIHAVYLDRSEEDHEKSIADLTQLKSLLSGHED